MTQFLSTLKSGARGVIVALMLGAASMVAAPAPALAQFTFDFGIKGGGNSFSFGLTERGNRFRRDCLTNNEIRRGLRRAGFSDVRIVDENRRRVIAIAEWEGNGRDYRMTVDRCTGEVYDIERLRYRSRNPSFGLQFQFGT